MSVRASMFSVLSDVVNFRYNNNAGNICGIFDKDKQERLVKLPKTKFL